MPKTNSFNTAAAYNNHLLANYQRQIKSQQRLLGMIKKALPEALAEHVLHCTLSSKKLLLYTSSASWSSQLRFYQQVILDSVNENNVNAEFVQIRLVNENSAPQSERKLNIPSKNSIELVKNCGESEEDEKLKQALLNLSQTLTKLSS